MQSSNSLGCSSSLKCFTVLEKLGEGSFASVYKVMRNDDKKLYAMKKAKIGQMKERERDNALNQVRVLASISHPNIVNYKQAFFDDSTQSLCIVMELADAGDVQKRINDHMRNHSHFTESEIWQALIQMARGLRALHQIKILHRDLKCANVFCTKEQQYKLGDLNVSKVAKRGMARTQTGTPYYTSPEVWKDQPYDSKCDIWSLGCVIYEMAALHPPFRANNLKELFARIQRGIFQKIPAFYSEDLFEVINLCLRVNPSKRLTAKQILQHPKVVKNTPISEKYALENNQTKKAYLLNTILCPRNLKSLKSALPAAKYEGSPRKYSRPKSVEGTPQIRRALSSKSIQRDEIPRVINSPKAGQVRQNVINYNLLRRPSSDRNNLRRQAVQIKNRQLSGRQYSQNKGSRICRNNSVGSIAKKEEPSRLVDNRYQRKSLSQQRNDTSNSRAKVVEGQMQDISNRCRNIEQRMKALMGLQGQRPNPQSNDKRYNMPIINSRQKREHSSRSRNAPYRRPTQVKKNEEIPKPGSIPYSYQPGLPRNRSLQRIERQDSKKRLYGGYLPPKR